MVNIAIIPAKSWQTECQRATPETYRRRHAHGAVTTFVESQYTVSYGARIKSDYQNFVAVFNARDEILAAVGWRPATGPLFLESYLSEPVDEVVSRKLQPVRRQQIVEIGNFAAQNGRAAYLALHSLMYALPARGYSHAVITATKQLRRTLHDIPMIHLADASVPAKSSDVSWGCYYDNAPQVIVAQFASYRDQYKRFLLKASRLSAWSVSCDPAQSSAIPEGQA